MLSYDNRFIRRKKLTSNNGIEFIVNLAETKSLYHNQAFKLESNKLILIKSQSEKLLEITGDNLIASGLVPKTKVTKYLFILKVYNINTNFKYI